MWSTLSKLFGLVNEEEGTSTDKGAAGAEESLAVCPQREWREFDGLVTSLHSSYGLIDNEVYFTHDVVSDGVMPRVGDTVHVKASRKHQVGGWKAECVSRVNASRSWDNDWEGDEEDEDVAEEGEEGIEAKTEESKERLEKVRRLREKRAIEKAALEELVADKMDVSITKFLDFGQMEIGETKSLKIEIKNNGTLVQTLCGWLFKSQSVSSQFELSPIRLLSIDLKQSSRKAQETLPMTLDPGKAAVVTVYCNARFLGLDQQIVVFEFEGFAIGRRIEVTVLDLTQLDLQPVVPYKKSQAVGRYQQTKEAWIVPGQRPNWRNSGAKIPKRLPQHPVPEYVRKCILEQRDVITVLPVLVKPLLPENYAARFSALLFLEEIQQEIDIREFDLDSVSMRVVGEFLALRIPGLAEGRPSLLIGDRAILSEPEESVLAPSYEGIIHEVLKDEVLLKFCEDFHNSYTGKDYNVRFIFSRTNFRRCHTAAEYASRLKSNILFPKSLDVKMSQMQSTEGSFQNAVATVVKVGPVTGIKRCPARPRAKEIYAGHVFFNDLLNSRQRSAVFRVLQGQGRPTPYIIFGPPGTGKTVTVVESILQIFYHLQNGCILACTPSNSAADLLAERLHQSGLVHVSDMVRVNAFQRGQENVVESVRPYCADVADLDTIKTKRIVVCTCSTAGMFYGMDLSACHFSHVFVDEAGQATEPECMIPVGLVAGSDGQIVLAGDPLQLGPVLRSNLAKDYGLQISYLERLSHLPIYTRDASKFVSHGSYDPLLVTKLVENYRSHPALLNLSSEIFYDGELVIAADKLLVECLCSWEHLPNKDSFPVLFHGIRGEDLREGNSPSWFNPQEAIQVMKYLQSVVHNDMYRLTYDDVGIITPYRKQVEKIRLLIDRLGMEKVKVGSVEEFQGQERLVMIISTVRSTESLVSVDLRYTLGFLSNPKRFNVSITRAHALLIIVGNPHVLSQDFYWCKLLQYCVANNAYIGCDLPEIGHIKSRTSSRRLSDDTGSSNVSSKDSAAVGLVPSTDQDSVETKEPGVCTNEGESSFLPGVNVYKSGNAFDNATSTDSCVESTDIAEEENDDAEKSVLNKDKRSNIPRDVVNGGSGNTMPVSRDYLDDSVSVDKQMQAASVSSEKEHRSSETLSQNPAKMETSNVGEMDSKMETYRNSAEFSAEHQQCVETTASKYRKTESDKELPTESKDPSSSDSVCPGHIRNKFTVCDTDSAAASLTCSMDCITLTAKMDVACDPSMIKCDDNVSKYVTDRTDDVFQSSVSTVEENANKMTAELLAPGIVEFDISPACDETVRNDVTDKIRCEGDAEDSMLAADTLSDDESASELEIAKCRQQFTGQYVLEKERNISEAVDKLQDEERTCIEDFKPIVPCASASADDSITPLKLDLAVKEELCHAVDKSLCADRKNLESAIPSGELARVFTNKGAVDSTAFQSCTMTDKELHLSVTGFTEDGCANIERPRLSDYDNLKSSLEPSFDKPLPCKDSNVAESSERLEDGFQYDEPNFGNRSLFDLVLDRDMESVISDVSLNVCVPDSVSSALTPGDYDVFDYEKFTGMRIADPSESCAYSDKSVNDVNRSEDNLAVGFPYCDSDLSKASVIPHPVPSGETSESNVVDGERVVRENLDDLVFEEDMHIRCPKSNLCDVVEMVSMTQPSHSGSGTTVQCPHPSQEEILRETLVQTAQAEMSKTEFRGSESAFPAGNGDSTTKDTTANIADCSKTTITVGTGDALEAGNNHQKLHEDSTGIIGVPVRSSISEPSLGVSVPYAPDSHVPAKSASQTTTTEMRTERKMPYSQMARGGGFSSQRRRGGFDREGARHSSKPFDRLGRGGGVNSPRGRFQAGREMNDVPFSANEEEAHLDLVKKIIHQMEYYFGDFNMMRDGFLQDQIARDIDGWVDLSVIITFNRMKALTTNFKVICDALRKSTSGVVEVSDDNTKVRRSSQKPLNTNMESWIKDLKTRAAVIKNYPNSETIDNMQSFFETYGGVAHIERGISKRCFHRGPSSGRPSFETVDLVIFLSEEGLKNLAKRRFTTLKRMGLSASFTDELSDQCVDYFYQRRVQGIPRQSLQPVGFSGSLGDGGIQRELTDGTKSQLNKNRPYQSSSLRNQKFRSNENSTTQNSSLNDDHRLMTSVSDERITAQSGERGDEGAAFGPEVGQSVSEMTIRPLMEDESGSFQRHSAGHRTTYRHSSKHQSANRSFSDSSNTYQKTFDHKALTEPRTARRPQSPRNGLEHSEGKRDIDKLLLSADNMSFSRRKPYSPSHQSFDSASLDSSNQGNTMTSQSGVSPISRQDAVSELSTKVPSPQKLDSCRQDLPSKPSRQSRRVKCFDPEFSFELAPSSSVVSDRHASENGLHMASTAEADSVPQLKPFVSSSPPRSIPEMNLISLTIGAEWSSAAEGRLQDQPQLPEVDVNESSYSWMNQNLESQVSEENLSYSLLSDQRDDDIIIESCCEEDLETSDDDNKGGWEAK